MVGSDGASGDSASAQEGGSGGVQGSCDSRAASGSCTEHAGYDMATLGVLQSGCASSMGTWSASACPRTGAVGGCRTTSGGSTDTQWAYQGDAAMLRSFCAMGGGTFVSP